MLTNVLALESFHGATSLAGIESRDYTKGEVYAVPDGLAATWIASGLVQRAADEVRPDAVVESIPAVDLGNLNKEQLKAWLQAAGVEYPRTARKPRLLEIATAALADLADTTARKVRNDAPGADNTNPPEAYRGEID